LQFENIEIYVFKSHVRSAFIKTKAKHLTGFKIAVFKLHVSKLQIQTSLNIDKDSGGQDKEKPANWFESNS
jgi:hypothetical protein